MSLFDQVILQREQHVCGASWLQSDTNTDILQDVLIHWVSSNLLASRVWREVGLAEGVVDHLTLDVIDRRHVNRMPRLGHNRH